MATVSATFRQKRTPAVAQPQPSLPKHRFKNRILRQQKFMVMQFQRHMAIAEVVSRL